LLFLNSGTQQSTMLTQRQNQPSNRWSRDFRSLYSIYVFGVSGNGKKQGLFVF